MQIPDLELTLETVSKYSVNKTLRSHFYSNHTWMKYWFLHLCKIEIVWEVSGCFLKTSGHCSIPSKHRLSSQCGRVEEVRKRVVYPKPNSQAATNVLKICDYVIASVSLRCVVKSLKISASLWQFFIASICFCGTYNFAEIIESVSRNVCCGFSTPSHLFHPRSVYALIIIAKRRNSAQILRDFSL